MKSGEEKGEDTNPELGPSACLSIVMASPLPSAPFFFTPHIISEQQAEFKALDMLEFFHAILSITPRRLLLLSHFSGRDTEAEKVSRPAKGHNTSRCQSEQDLPSSLANSNHVLGSDL